MITVKRRDQKVDVSYYNNIMRIEKNVHSCVNLQICDRVRNKGKGFMLVIKLNVHFVGERLIKSCSGLTL